jgi:uncharacterized membrane protein
MREIGAMIVAFVAGSICLIYGFGTFSTTIMVMRHTFSSLLPSFSSTNVMGISKLV